MTRIKKLVQAYASITNKDSEKAVRIMRLINILRARKILKQELEIEKYRDIVASHNKKISGYCTRCNNKGMGMFHHIQRGVCFRCGRMPVI
jgi:hypothetical protein